MIEVKQMKKYALYPGCIMPTEQNANEMSIREILLMGANMYRNEILKQL